MMGDVHAAATPFAGWLMMLRHVSTGFRKLVNLQVKVLSTLLFT
jgi:hypothetical protein